MSDSTLKRRDLLAGLALAASAASACKEGGEALAAPAAPAPAPAGEWERIRAEFELSKEWVHLGGFLLASHPRLVRQAIEQHRKGLDDNPVHYLHQHEQMDAVLAAAARYMDVAPTEIALTDSTTMALALLYHGLPLRSGDEVVTSAHDHFATHESLRLATERVGASVRRITLYEQGAAADKRAMVSAVIQALTPKTRVLALTWVHSCTGVKTPIAEISAALARANAARPPGERVLFCVDGVHGFGIEDASMKDLGCDFFAAGCHKWLFGPRGTGLLWGKAEHWSMMRPVIPQFGPEAYGAWMRGKSPPPTNAAMMTPGGFHSFEHRWALAEAFAFHLGLGKAKVATRIHALNTRCKTALSSMRHVTLHTPLAAELSSGIICFEVAGKAPDEVVRLLHEKGIIATQTPYLPTYARLAPGLLNSDEDVDRATAAIGALA